MPDQGRTLTCSGCGRSCTPQELALHDHGEYGPDLPGRVSSPGDDCDEGCWGFTLEECGHGPESADEGRGTSRHPNGPVPPSECELACQDAGEHVAGCPLLPGPDCTCGLAWRGHPQPHSVICAVITGRGTSEPIVGPHTCSCDDCQRIYREHLARKAGRSTTPEPRFPCLPSLGENCGECHRCTPADEGRTATPTEGTEMSGWRQDHRRMR